MLGVGTRANYSYAKKNHPEGWFSFNKLNHYSPLAFITG